MHAQIQTTIVTAPFSVGVMPPSPAPSPLSRSARFAGEERGLTGKSPVGRSLSQCAVSLIPVLQTVPYFLSLH